jgi:heterodisulfide reductase subunit B
MEKEQMIEIILREEREAREFMNEMVENFGRQDDYTKRTIAQWCVIAELIEKLKIENNEEL